MYERGIKYSSACFTAFCLCASEAQGPKIGFTVPRALGKAVVRNRIKRRVREAARLCLSRLNPQCSIVINPRKKALDAPFAELEREMERLFHRCSGLSS